MNYLLIIVKTCAEVIDKAAHSLGLPSIMGAKIWYDLSINDLFFKIVFERDTKLINTLKQIFFFFKTMSNKLNTLINHLFVTVKASAKVNDK